MQRIYAKQEVCIACRLCEVYCAASHAEGRDLVRAWRGKGTRPIPRVKVEENRPFAAAIQCHHCEEPACVYACLSGSMRRLADGTVQSDPDRCIGCWTCVLACPYGAISRSGGEKPTVVKCDLCPGLAIPACVANCPNGALEMVKTDKTREFKGGVAG
ncbi:MAG: 4Fe-4S dicluster domain-containing protein [Bacillota bacterium]